MVDMDEEVKRRSESLHPRSVIGRSRFSFLTVIRFDSMSKVLSARRETSQAYAFAPAGLGQTRNLGAAPSMLPCALTPTTYGEQGQTNRYQLLFPSGLALTGG